MKLPSIIRLQETVSTNTELAERLKLSRPEPYFAIQTEWQSYGKGQGDHRWYSSKGKNLLFSFVIYPHFIEARSQFAINQAISLAICDSLKDLTSLNNIQIKWPNDIYCGSKKLAGILIEHQIKSDYIDNSIIGIGLNVNEDKFPEDLSSATSVFLECNQKGDILMFLESILKCTHERLETLHHKGIQSLEKEYLAKLYRYKTEAEYLFRDEKIIARIEGIDEFGRLVLSRSNGKELRCDTREIRFL